MAPVKSARHFGLAVLLAAAILASARAETLPLPNDLIALDSEQGQRLFFHSEANKAYFPLGLYFVTQDHPTFCGPASIAMVLNALHIRRPPSKFTLSGTASICADDRACSLAREKYRYFLGRAFHNNDEFVYYLEANPTLFKNKEWKENGVTFIEIGDNIDPLWSEITILTSGLTGLYDQENIFDARTEAVKTRAAVMQSGVTLDELGKMLAAHDLKVSVHHAGDSSLEEFRKLIVSELGGSDRFVLVNYLRSGIGQSAMGHISPLAAYDRDSDRFLILDVSRYKYPPVWVEAQSLFAAMNTADKDNGNLTRGYMIVGR
jgi:hypothetical protein